ncbi:MAG: filamentous hemagglutinin N-terminal domain-containing protein, partial [Chitinimonas sp.]|nr:filamentous hemagglutinin N-terminal domain-containing protein [Chitinimonas sp.]
MPIRALPFRPTLLALACLAALSVRAELPSTPTVVSGDVTFSPNGSVVTQASDRAIVNWGSFSISADQLMRFLQPGNQSVMLNRVIGNDPSQILGQLQANGRIFLVNPNGVYFGAGARVDVGGLLATTMDIRNEDFLAGRYTFHGKGNAATVINDGSLRAADGGFIALAGDRVINRGLIEARLGSVFMGAGHALQLDLAGDGLISYALSQEALGELAGAANSGQILADGGRVIMAARTARSLAGSAVNQAGLIRAQGVAGQDGEIELLGTGGNVSMSGQLDVSGASGGQVRLESDATTVLTGTVAASGSADVGGRIAVLGQQVALTDTARLDASGQHGGGQILVGGDWQGKGTVTNAQRTLVQAGAQLLADATQQGNGGKVVVWADGDTRFAGHISAQGGALAGNGGAVEVSGKDKLAFNGTVNTSAANGNTGALLLDPSSLTITNGAAATGDQAGSVADGTLFAADPDTNPNTLAEQTLEGLTANTNVVIEATGEILLKDLTDNLLNMKQTSAGSLRITSTQSGGIRYEDVNDEIRTAGGSITLQALGSGALNIGKLNSGNGNITLKSSASASLGHDIRAGSGSITLDMANGALQTTTSTGLFASGLLLKGSGYFRLLSYGGSGFYTSTNQIGTLAASLTGGSVQYSGNSAISLGSVAGVNGYTSGNGSLQVYNNNGITFAQDVNLGSGTGFFLAGANAGLNQSGGSIIADGLMLKGSGNFNLASAGNDVNVLAADTSNGSITFRDKDELAVGNVWNWVIGISTQGGNLSLRTGSPTATPDYSKPFGDAANPASLKIDNNVNLGGGQLTLELDQGGVLQRNVAGETAGSIVAGSLVVKDQGNSSKVNTVSLSNANNQIDVLAASLNGSFFYTGAPRTGNTVTIGSVGGVNGIRTTSNTIVAPADSTTTPPKPPTYNTNNVSLSIGGNLNISQNITTPGTWTDTSNVVTTKQRGSVTIGIGGDFLARTINGAMIYGNSLGLLGEVGQGTFNIKSEVETLVAGGGKDTIVDNSSYTGLLAAAAIGAVSDAIDLKVPTGTSSNSSSTVPGSPGAGGTSSASGGTTTTTEVSLDAVNKPVGNFYLTTGDDLRIIKLNSNGDTLFLRANNMDVVLDAATKNGARIILQPFGLSRTIRVRADDPSNPYVAGVTTDTTYTWETLLKFTNLTSTFYFGARPYALTDPIAAGQIGA